MKNKNENKVIDELLNNTFFNSNLVFQLICDLLELSHEEQAELLNNKFSVRYIQNLHRHKEAREYRRLQVESLHLFCVNLKNKLKKGDKK